MLTRFRNRFAALYRNLAHKDQVDRDLDTELRAFEQLLIDEKLTGIPALDAGQARRAARIEIDATIEQIKEQVREVRMGFSLDSVARDVRISARTLRKQAGFSLTVLGVLALGIAGATAIFSMFNSLYLRPLPFPEAEHLVNLDEKAPQWNLERVAVAYPDFVAWREHNRSFSAIAVFRGTGAQISSDTGAEQVPAARATFDLLDVLKVQPAVGRWFHADEDKPNGPKLVVVSHQMWQRRFGGPAAISGQTLRIASETFQVIGVMPPGFDFPSRAEVWTALGMSAGDSTGWGLNGVARLRPGISMDKALEDLLRVHKGMIPTRKVNEITSPTIYPLREWYVGQFLPASRALLIAVTLVLLIACANIAGVMLARGSSRIREVSLMAALGASRTRIIRQLLTESLLLGVAGGVLGTLIGRSGLRLLLGLMPQNQVPGWVRFDLDWRFLMFCLAVSMGSAMLFGLWPAWSASRADLRSALHEGGARASGSAARRRSLKILITAEVALATVLLAASALLTQAFRKVEQINPGFRADNVLTYSVGLPNQKYPKPEQKLAFIEELIRKQRELPGVRFAAAVSATPLGGHWGNFYEVEGAPQKRAGDPDPVILKRVVTPDYLEAMGMTLRSGRTFNAFDGRKEGTEAVVVNETFARQFWPGQNPIGKRIRHRGGKIWWPVVGMIADVKDYGLDQESRPSVYFPLAQEPLGGLSVVVRTAARQDLAPFTNTAREVLKRLDPDIALARPVTMEQRLADSMWIRRTYSFLVAAFAVLALVLVGSGLFGVISYTVGQRRREIAIRMALGASQRVILRNVLQEAFLLAGIGLVLGVAAGAGLARISQSLRFDSPLFGVDPRDPATYAAAAAVLLAVAVSASLAPAIRASYTSPSSALRLE
ncbi:MAG: ABC transporter permease [Acidobacteria bacterium]|nr:ABC transporter permease [Acidobacteriota bacterium]